MNDIKIGAEEIYKILQENLPKVLKDSLLDSYGSPLKKAVAEEISAQEGSIRTLVRDTLATILNDQKFKDKLVAELIGTIIQKGLTR